PEGRLRWDGTREPPSRHRHVGVPRPGSSVVRPWKGHFHSSLEAPPGGDVIDPHAIAAPQDAASARGALERELDERLARVEVVFEPAAENGQLQGGAERAARPFPSPHIGPLERDVDEAKLWGRHPPFHVEQKAVGWPLRPKSIAGKGAPFKAVVRRLAEGEGFQCRRERGRIRGRGTWFGRSGCGVQCERGSEHEGNCVCYE